MDTIALKNIKFHYPGSDDIFSGLNFSLTAGIRAGITGSNGSGKSTLLKIISGLIKPQAGSVELFGNEMKEEKDFSRFRTKIGYLFQNPDDQILFPEVEEDISFGPLNQGKNRIETGEIVTEVIKEFGLKSLKKRNTFKLSGGEKHLVALAGIAAMKPDIILLDEPFEWLDGHHLQIVLDYLSKVDSFILISQDVQLLKRLCAEGEIYVLEKGLLKKEKGEGHVF